MSATNTAAMQDEGMCAARTSKNVERQSITCLLINVQSLSAMIQIAYSPLVLVKILLLTCCISFCYLL